MTMRVRSPGQTQCFSCGAAVPDMDGPVHRYMASSPGCWALFGEVLAREYSDYAYARTHRRTVDAYAVQHPGQPSPQTTRSVAIHLVRLYLVLERGLPADLATRTMQKLAGHKSGYFWLEPPDHVGPVTVADIWAAPDADAHATLVQEWAASAWAVWETHHGQVRKWVEAYA